jgi:hypothetical protein
MELNKKFPINVLKSYNLELNTDISGYFVSGKNNDIRTINRLKKTNFIYADIRDIEIIQPSDRYKKYNNKMLDKIVDIFIKEMQNCPLQFHSGIFKNIDNNSNKIIDYLGHEENAAKAIGKNKFMIYFDDYDRVTMCYQRWELIQPSKSSK